MLPILRYQVTSAFRGCVQIKPNR